MIYRLLQHRDGPGSSDGRADRGPRIVAGVAALLAVGLLTLALPRTLAAFVAPPDDIVSGSASAEPDRLRTGLDRERLALRIAGDPGAADRAAAIEVALAREAGFREPAGRRHLDAAIELTRESLAAAPARPHAWERLSYVLVVRDGPSRAAADAVGMSLLTGYESPRHARSRLSLVLLAWNEFDLDDRAAAERLIRDLWRAEPRLVADFAVRYRADTAVRGVLADAGGTLAEFDALVAEFR